MSNSLLKQERRRARVWGIRKDSGRFKSRLTTPTHAGAFLAPCCSGTAGKAILMVARTELESTLHRLANLVECELADIFRELLAESRIDAVQDIAWGGCRFIEALRCVRDGKEGSEV